MILGDLTSYSDGSAFGGLYIDTPLILGEDLSEKLASNSFQATPRQRYVPGLSQTGN